MFLSFAADPQTVRHGGCPAFEEAVLEQQREVPCCINGVGKELGMEGFERREWDGWG
jgi:hypothetical protein